jgi:hypothetical protein
MINEPMQAGSTDSKANPFADVQRIDYVICHCPNKDKTWNYGDWVDSNPDTATHIILDIATYSDYSGSTLERSNHDALLEDFPNDCIDTTGGYHTRGLMVRMDCKNQTLIDALIGLGEYPIYDDDAICQLEIQICNESWDQWLSNTVKSELTARIRYYNQRLLEKMIIANDIDNRWFNRLSESVIDVDNDDLRSCYYRLTYNEDCNETPYCEDAVSAVFPEHDRVMNEIFRKLSQGENLDD